jgi:hypothetical protein
MLCLNHHFCQEMDMVDINYTKAIHYQSTIRLTSTRIIVKSQCQIIRSYNLLLRFQMTELTYFTTNYNVFKFKNMNRVFSWRKVFI